MANNIKVLLSSNIDDVYYDSIYIVNQLMREKNVYASSQKRLTMADYIFAIMDKDKQVGFISAVKGDNFYDDIISLEVCLLEPYRCSKSINKLIPKIVKRIETDKNYDNEYIILEKNRSHVFIDGIRYSDDIILLQNRLEEIDYDHPDGIKKNHRIITSKEAFVCANKEKKI